MTDKRRTDIVVSAHDPSRLCVCEGEQLRLQCQECNLPLSSGKNTTNTAYTPTNTNMLKTINVVKKQLIGKPAAVLSCVKFCWTRGGKKSESRACLASVRSCCRAAPAVCPSFPQVDWRTSGDMDNQGSARTKAMWLQSLCRDPNKQLHQHNADVSKMMCQNCWYQERRGYVWNILADARRQKSAHQVRCTE